MFQSILIAVVCVGAFDVEVKTLDEKATSGSVVSLTSEQLTLKTDQKKQAEFEVSKLLSMTPKNAPSPSKERAKVWVTLTDGSRLLASSLTIKADVVTIHALGLGETKIPVHTIHAIRLKKVGKLEVRLAKQWRDILDTKATGDIVVLRKTATKKTGDIETSVTSLDYFEGIIHDITQDKIEFEFDDEIRKIDRKRVEGVIYLHKTTAKLPKVVCSITDAAGSRWNVASLDLKDQDIQIQTSGGIKRTLPWNVIRNFDFSSGKVAYLSDMKADSIEWKPFLNVGETSEKLSQMFLPRKDRSFSGQPLSLGAGWRSVRTFKKGLAIHSRTQMTYRLSGDFSRLKAIAGIDPSVRKSGHVRLIISGDSKELFNQEIAGTDKPVAIDLDIRGVRRIKILVDFGKNLDIGDHLNLCNARVVK